MLKNSRFILLLVTSYAVAAIPTPAELGNQLQTCLKEKKLNAHFLWGVSTSGHQNNNRCTPATCSWSRFAQEKNLPQPSDAEFRTNCWDYHREYSNFMKKDLQLNAFRFSVEWALIQPDGPDSYDEQVLAHYAQMFVHMIKQGITPIVVFHHYTDPCWFLDRGGFEKKDNSKFFVEFCSKVYVTLITALADDNDALEALKAMNPRQPLWATFNSPEGYAFKGYREMTSPPASPRKKGINWAVLVLKNMLEAHVQVYKELKETYYYLDLSQFGIRTPQIGFLKNIHQLDPAMQTIAHQLISPLSSIICLIGNKLQHTCIYDFFKTGVFSINIPGMVNITHKNPDAIHSLDFIGLNYYSNRYLFGSKSLVEKNPTYQTDNQHYRIYPHGLYRGIKELSDQLARPLGIPIYVTENGIATTDENKRYNFYQQYLNALYRAISEGYDVRGYLPWTLADNYEWPSLTSKKRRLYGLCSLDATNPAILVPKKGAQSYLECVKSFKN